MTTTADLLVLVDLDGTLVRSNSFHLWLRHMLSSGLRTLSPPARYAGRLIICVYALLRLGRMISHARLKRGCQAVWGRALARSTDPQFELDSFLAALMAHVDDRVAAWVARAQRGGAVAVLTTAAPGDYAVPLAHRLGFDGVVATPRADREPWSENLREMKQRNTSAYVEDRGWNNKRTILFTDHVDDLPLMRVVQEVCLIADDATTVTVRQSLGGLIPVRSLDEVVCHAR